MNNKKKMIEDALLSGKTIDELIKLKMKEEIKAAFKKVSTKFERKRVVDIKQVPKEYIFSKNAVFKKFNKTNNTISFINGIQAEALFGLDVDSREKILEGKIEVFSTDNAFIKFEYADVIVRS